MEQDQKNVSFAGSIPENYDGGMGDMFFEPYAKEMVKRVVILQPGQLLEIACGTGRLTKYLSQQLPEALITATDLTPSMLEFAKKKFPAFKNVTWEIADGLSLPFKNASFDCVVVQFGVMFYPDKLQGLKEAFRVLKNGGNFVFATWNSLEKNPISNMANEVVKGFFPDDPPKFFHIPFSYYNESIIRKELSDAGFKNVEIETIALTGHNITAENAARGLLEGSPIINFINENAPDKLPEIKQKFVERIISDYGKEKLSIPLNALIVKAQK